jgi:hypothetical protein
VDPVWFVVLAPVVWLLFAGLFARISGWASLATQFRSRGGSNGETFRFASASTGVRRFPVNDHACLSIVVGGAGLSMALLLPLRLQNPALFIPCSQAESIERKKMLFSSSAVIRVRHQWPVIAIHGAAGQRIADAHAPLQSRPRRSA